MTHKDFNKVWTDALAQDNFQLYCEKQKIYFAEEYNASIEREIVAIHKIAWMHIKDIVKYAGCTQKEFALRYCIPLRTVEGWCTGKRNCNDYIRLLICRDLGLLDVE